nr:putative reverse transcriptase domain-containing protein [Tanacetum cinerariifolium]
MQKGRLQTKEILKTLPKTTKADSSLLKGKMWQGHTLQDLVIGNSMQGLDLCDPNAISTMTVHVLQDATELADGRIVGINTVIHSCTPNFLNHPFNIDLMLVKMGSFDVIIGRIGYRDIRPSLFVQIRLETLILHGDGSNQEHEAQLNIISCAKTQKYMLKGFQVFLAHVTTKEAEGKSKKKRLENVPIIRYFPKVFPEDLPGLPPTRQVVFQIDLIPSAASVVRAPYRLAPPEMKELSKQLKELSDKGFI